MPDWTNYYGGTSTSSDVFTFISTSLSAQQIQQDYEEYRQETLAQQALDQQMWEEHERMLMQQRAEEKQLKEDKKKYPLFFLKEGIV